MPIFFRLVGGSLAGRRARAQNLGEPARFDAQRRVKRDLQTLVDNLKYGTRGRIVVVGLAPIDRVGRRECHHPRLGINRPARQAEAFRIPCCLGLAAGLDPILSGLDQIGLRDHGIDQLHRLGAIDLELLTLEKELKGIGGRDHARDALGAAGAGEQTDLDLGKAEPCFRIVGSDPVVASKRELETAAHCRSVERADPRFAARFDPSVDLRQLAAFIEDERCGYLLALRAHQICEHSAHALKHGEICAPAEGVLA